MSYFKNIVKLILSQFLAPIKKLIKKRHIIIFSGRNNYTYNGNSRYLFEYLSTKNNLEVYWFTRSNDIKKYITDNKMNYLSYDNPFKLIYKLLFMRIVFNDGDDYLNLFKLSDSEDIYKICLFHGYGPKTTIAALGDKIEREFRISRINKFDYVNFTSKFGAEIIGKNVFNLPNKKLKVLGNPSVDSFYDSELTNQRLATKPRLNELFPSVSNTSKLILYTPTWRPYDYNLPLLDINNFSPEEFNDFLTDVDMYLVYTTHGTKKPKKIIKNLSRIYHIGDEMPLYDTNEMMLEADILMNDYSTTSVEFSVLNRSQIFCIPDFNKYNAIKGFIENYLEILPGESFDSLDKFKILIKAIMLDEQEYVNTFKEQREEILSKYYCLENYLSKHNYETVVEQLINH